METILVKVIGSKADLTPAAREAAWAARTPPRAGEIIMGIVLSITNRTTPFSFNFKILKDNIIIILSD